MGNVDNNSCAEGTVAGGLLGGTFGGVLSTKDNWIWAIPTGIVSGKHGPVARWTVVEVSTVPPTGSRIVYIKRVKGTQPHGNPLTHRYSTQRQFCPVCLSSLGWLS